MPSELGLFEVRICASEGKVRAILTGRHFPADEADMATRHAESENAKALSGEGAPTFLVMDPVVAFAVDAAERAPRNGLSPCHEGKGSPCGTCGTCMEAMREAFTASMLRGMDPPGPLGDRLKITVMSVMGIPRIGIPWGKAMSEEEVNDMLERVGGIGLLQPGKETE